MPLYCAIPDSVNNGRRCLLPCFVVHFAHMGWFYHGLGGWEMTLLGSRLRHRRRQMRLRQRDVTGAQSASFLSKVENGAVLPSLNNLADWSDKLQTTPSNLMGDQLVLEAAKHCVLLTEKCHSYLDHLNPSPTTHFLRQLSTSATALSVSVPEPPEDPELQCLTAKVLMHKGQVEDARVLAEKVLPKTYSPFLRMRILSLLCQIYTELDEPHRRKQLADDLHEALLDLDHSKLLHSLPSAEEIQDDDLHLLTLCELTRCLKQLD